MRGRVLFHEYLQDPGSLYGRGWQCPLKPLKIKETGFCLNLILPIKCQTQVGQLPKIYDKIRNYEIFKTFSVDFSFSVCTKLG